MFFLPSPMLVLGKKSGGFLVVSALRLPLCQRHIKRNTESPQGADSLMNGQT